MTQADKMLAWLRDRGPRGLHTFEMRQHYCGNPSQRISELEARGHVFTRTREKLHGQATGTRYVLVVDAESSGAASPQNADSLTAAPEQLFNPPSPPTPSPYRTDAA